MHASFDTYLEIQKPIANRDLTNLMFDINTLLARTSAYEVTVRDSSIEYEDDDSDIAISGTIYVNGYCNSDEARDICWTIEATGEAYGLECDYCS